MKLRFSFLILFFSLAMPAQKFDMDLVKNMTPRNIGPGGMSGRVTSIDVVEANPDVMYVGTASGGIWKSTSGGILWEPIFDGEVTASIGAIAIEQSNPSVVWAGTGEGNPRNSLNGGYGVFKSLDGGKTWKTSHPFPAKGTGEATLAELSDGTIYYNTRRHWAEEGANPRRRWTATSNDGGMTWKDLTFCEVLPDGPQNTNYGCMAGLTRLAVKGRDILLYSNCDSAGGRHHGTVWASFDGGKTWPVKRLVFEGAHAYSSMTSGRPGTVTEGMIFHHFEGGPKGGSAVARFNLAWILQKSESTGDGKVPEWVK